jgi:hypothetical protein
MTAENLARIPFFFGRELYVDRVFADDTRSIVREALPGAQIGSLYNEETCGGTAVGKEYLSWRFDLLKMRTKRR